MNMNSDKFIVIPSIRMVKDLSYALTLHNDYVLLSEIHIGNLKSFVDMCHKAKKKVVVNAELIGGLNLDKIGIHLLKNLYSVDMVICSSTAKLNMIKGIGLETMHRVTLMDSKSLNDSLKALADSKCDFIEVRPGFYGLKFIEQIKKAKNVPVFLGGFVENIEMITAAKKAGIIGITTSSKELWRLTTK